MGDQTLPPGSFSVSAPPIRGPKRESIVPNERIAPINVGLFSKGATAAKVLRAPFSKPVSPIPATAGPTINIVEPFAVAQRSDINSKTPGLQGMCIGIEVLSAKFEK